MNRISFTVEVAKDGGLVVYADEGGTAQELVFGGNQKDTCDYIAKRIGELKAEKVMPGRYEAVPGSHELRRIDEACVTDFRRTGAIS